MKGMIIPVTAFQQNCSLLWCEETGKGAVIDPGGDLEVIEKQIEEHEIDLEKILLTHGHLDHAGGAGELAERRGLPIEGPHEEDDFLLQALPEQCAKYGMLMARIPKPDRWLVGGDTVTIGNLTLDVKHCPGHTPGHVVYFHEPSRLAVVGDVLFQGSIGRTDFPRGDHETLLRSIREQLWPLGNDVAFIPGHGPMSTFGDERKSNPFVHD